MTHSARDHRFMTLALRLAAKGRGRTSPNPMVGAVVVSKGKIVGRGYHRQVGGPHAEVLALQQAGPRAKDATLYVTLEPCSHTGKRTAPCTPLLIQSRLRRVVVAMVDPNPCVKGRGIRALQRAGLNVKLGCGRAEAEELNPIYCHWMQTGLPFVILKAAMTLDGKIATATGESKWITGDIARRHVHTLRRQVDAILVGVGTVIQDNPSLTARVSAFSRRLAGRQPLRVVVDSHLRLPLTARVLTNLEAARTLIATTKFARINKRRQLEARGAEVWVLPERQGRVSLSHLLSRLGHRHISNLLVEGGSEVNASIWRASLADHVMLYVTPRILGGQDAKSLVGGQGPRHLAQATMLDHLQIHHAGTDLLIEGTPRKS